MFTLVEDAWAITKTKSGLFQIRKVFLRKDKLYLQMGSTTYVEVLDETRTSNPLTFVVEHDFVGLTLSKDSLGRLRASRK